MKYIQAVATNLRNTIAGKERHLVSLNIVLAGHYLTDTERTVCATTAKFLEVNLDELRRILQDVEQCAIIASDIAEHFGIEGE